MNSKATGRPTSKPATGLEVQGGEKAGTKGKALRPGKKTTPGGGYGIYRDAAPVKTTPPPAGRPPAAPALAEALRAVTAEVNALKKDVAQKDTEIKAIQKRLTQMEARQKSQEKAFRSQQPPGGMPPRQAIMGLIDVEEMSEE